MTVSTFFRGWKAHYDEEKQTWFYEDGQPVGVGEKPCRRCGRPPTPEGIDACLGYIKGAVSACCGHGVEEGYTIYRNKECEK